ncbi:hypothetical protein HDU86_004323 [Geranomyces michiganensis]|nr:hypothetical protein HDU86_004323 [Geranomyces michiganensis]
MPVDSNKTPASADPTVPELVAAQVCARPEKTALIYCNANDTLSRTSYQEIWTLATAAARAVETYITPKVTKHDSRISAVGILIDEGLMLPVMHLAALMTSAAMVPLDYKDPRLHLLIEEAGCDAVIAKDDACVHVFEAALAKCLTRPDSRPWPPPCITLTALQQAAAGPSCSAAAAPFPSPSAISHIYFTSGSTGRPKGCISTHAALASYCHAKNAAHAVTHDSIVFVASAPTFDPSLGDFCSAWIAGATVASTDASKRLADLGLCLQKTSATHLLTTPSLFSTLQGAYGPDELPQLQTIALGGEPMSAATATTWADRVRLLNTYGVTECCVYQAYAQIGPGVSLRAIGTPLAGNELLVMTNDGELETFAKTPADAMRAIIHPAAGDVGELWIAGRQVGIGYLDRPELSAQKFVAHPKHGMCFRTGDIVSAYAQGGECHWRLVGRLDAQIKVNGQRFDPGETEAVLLSKTAPILLSRAAVVYHPGKKLLLAYCVPAQADEYLQNASRTKLLTVVLRTECAENLPAHMCPARFLLVSELPETSTGKIARAVLAKLPLPAESTAAEAQEGNEALPSYGGWSAVVRKAWRDVLGTAPRGALSHFAELGGDSLAALRVCKQIASVYRREGSANNNGADDADSAVARSSVFGELLGVLAPAELLKRPALGEYARYLYMECGGLNGGNETIDDPTATAVGTGTGNDDQAQEPEPHTMWESQLLAAAGCGAARVIDFLVRKHVLLPANEAPPARRRNTPTALHIACLNGHVEAARVLLLHGGASVFSAAALDSSGATPLHLAAQAKAKGSLTTALVKLLLLHSESAPPAAAKKKKGPASIMHHPTHRVDFARQTPLHHAARSGAPTAVLTALLSASPDAPALLAARDQWGRTALHWAVVNGHRGCVAALLEAGADRKAVDDAGEGAVEMAERRARCGASERGAGVVASVFADIAKLLGGSGTTSSVKRFVTEK